MTVLVWVAEGTWKASVDAARALAPPGADVALMTVIDTGTAEAAHGAFGGMLGRAADDPAERLSAVAEAAASGLLDAAQARLGQPARLIKCRGRGKHEIVAAAEGAAMLIVVRDGPGAGPKSLGKEVRFVVDHAPCPVLLVWPGPPRPVPDPPPPGTHPPHEPHGPRKPDHGRRPGPPGWRR
jgi:nucleotide-binding universal stress UspA family protein